MSNDLNLGDLGITINVSEGEPASAEFTLPDGSVVTRPFTDGELNMRLGLGLGLGYQPPVGGETPPPVITDPHFANVVLLAGFDGADGATTATDESSKGHALAFFGNAQIDTASSKFGGASLLIDGTGDYVTAPDGTDWEFSGEFTIEAFVRFNSLPSTGTILAHAASSTDYGWRLGTSNLGQVTLAFDRVAGGAVMHTITSGSSKIAVGAAYYHIAVDRDASGKMRLYVNGVMEASKVAATGASHNTAGALSIGSTAASLYGNGWVEEVRITKGVARYASDSGFTVPTATFPRSGGASAPSNTGLPVISGTAASGQTLSTTNGTWNDGGAEISGYAYQWNADGVAITGATSSTFGLTNTQIGAVITVTVTATNAAGSTAATSAGTAPVTAGGATDPHFANVVLLVGFDGADGSTTFTDESSVSRTLTPSADAQVDTAQLKFGTGSGLFDATGDLITAADSADWEFPGEFTIECWIRPRIVSSGIRGVVAHWATSGQANWSLRQSVDDLLFIMSTDGATIAHQVNADNFLAANTWLHVAVDRDASGTLRIYANGVMRGSKAGATGSFNSSTPLRIAAATGTTQLFDGHIDELRITKGVARYASDAGFAVPAAAFPRS